MAGANRVDKQARNQQRIIDGSKLKERVEAYAHMKTDARIEAVHDALMFSIDRILDDHPRAFTSAQAEVLRDVAFQMVHLVLPASEKPKGLVRGCIHQYKESDAFGKVKVIAAVIVAVVAVATTIWTWGSAAAKWISTPAGQVQSQPNLSPTAKKPDDRLISPAKEDRLVPPAKSAEPAEKAARSDVRPPSAAPSK